MPASEEAEAGALLSGGDGGCGLARQEGRWRGVQAAGAMRCVNMAHTDEAPVVRLELAAQEA